MLLVQGWVEIRRSKSFVDEGSKSLPKPWLRQSPLSILVRGKTSSSFPSLKRRAMVEEIVRKNKIKMETVAMITMMVKGNHKMGRENPTTIWWETVQNDLSCPKSIRSQDMDLLPTILNRHPLFSCEHSSSVNIPLKIIEPHLSITTSYWHNKMGTSFTYSMMATSLQHSATSH